jgi:hypothetical protein
METARKQIDLMPIAFLSNFYPVAGQRDCARLHPDLFNPKPK